MPRLMWFGSYAFIALFSTTVLLCVMPAAAREPESKAGDGAGVNLHYVCRMKSGEIIATTEKNIGEDPSRKKSEFFAPPSSYAPVAVFAGQGCKSCPPFEKNWVFTDHIADELARQIAGLKSGEKKDVSIKAAVGKDMTDQDRYIKIDRVTSQPKDVEMRKTTFIERVKKEPVVGLKVNVDPIYPGKVTGIKDDKVMVRLSPKNGAEVKSPFGRAHIRDAGKNYEIVVDARVGTMVRTGGLLGRIVAVDDQMFTLDYGEPFAGEEFSCEVWSD